MNLPEPNATDFRKALADEEGCIPWMYLDTRGNVTVGIGHMLPTADSARQLSWVGGGDAGQDWAAVKAHTPGLLATGYQGLSSCRLSEDSIRELCDSDVDITSAQICNQLQEFTSYPPCVQQALLDMAFNLGVAGLMKFKKLIAACNESDWKTASDECVRQGISAVRNKRTQDLILSVWQIPNEMTAA